MTTDRNLYRAVRDAYKRCRRYRQYRRSTILAEAQLAQSSHVLAMLPEHVAPSAEYKALALRALMQWVTDRLRPYGDPVWSERTWRAWSILSDYYLAAQPLPTMLDKLVISESTFFSSATAALEDATQLLYETEHDSVAQRERTGALIAQMSGRVSADARRMVRRLAIYRNPVPMQVARTLFGTDESGLLDELLADDLLLHTADRTAVFVPDAARPTLNAQLQMHERVQWYHAAAQSRRAANDPLQAADYFFEARQFEAAATLLIDAQESLLHAQSVAQLEQLARRFQRDQLPEQVWWALQLLIGRIMRQRDDVESTLSLLKPLLAVPDKLLQAQAYYQMGRALQVRDLDAALHHFARCIALLQHDERSTAQIWRATAHIERGWIFLRDRPNRAAATEEITQAEQLIDRLGNDASAHLRSDFHGAYGMLAQRNQLPNEAEHRWRAWDYAHLAASPQRILRTAHNLGTYYWRNGEYNLALRHLQESLDLAEKGGHLYAIANNQKHIGACHFQLGDYARAHDFYRKAYDRYVEMGATMWRAYVCYDLAEVLIHLHRPQEALYFFNEGLQLGEQLEIGGFVAGMRRLGEEYGELSAETTPRHVAILAYVREHAAITKKQCAQLTDLKDRQAVRVLNELVANGELVKAGKGRATRYVLP